MLIFDAAGGDGRTLTTGGRFELVLDGVMGGRSSGALSVTERAGRRALCLSGEVRTENRGGFVQMATDWAVDASPFAHLRLTVLGNDEAYGCHLKTADALRPWQSYRQAFVAPPIWTEIDLPLAGFRPHRLEAPFDPSSVRRLGLVAIGRPFTADLALARVELVPRSPGGAPS